MVEVFCREMTETLHSFEGRKEFTDIPYKELYIYYLNGRLKPGNEIYGSGFIGNWQEDDCSFLFFSKPSPDEVLKILNSNPQLAILDEFHMTYDQWQGGKTTLEKIGRFCIVPPWRNNEKKLYPCQKELAILLDPGVVFGNGLHTTTRDCLKALEMVFLHDCVEFAMDIGTGTGILALAASLLGCKRTLAIDFNFLAAHTASRNVRLNSLENRILVTQGRAEDYVDSVADLVIANIHFDVMKHLTASQGFYNKKWFILSGLLRSQARDVSFNLSRNRIKIIKTWECDGIWHTFLGKKD
jgi:ribosomal protein L11 methyltransferase